MKKNYKNINRKFKSGSHYNTNILNNNYNIDFSPFLIDLQRKIYKRKNFTGVTLDKIFNKK